MIGACREIRDTVGWGLENRRYLKNLHLVMERTKSLTRWLFNVLGEIHVARIRRKLSCFGLGVAPDKRRTWYDSKDAYRLRAHSGNVQHWRTPGRLWRLVLRTYWFLDGRGEFLYDRRDFSSYFNRSTVSFLGQGSREFLIRTSGRGSTERHTRPNRSLDQPSAFVQRRLATFGPLNYYFHTLLLRP